MDVRQLVESKARAAREAAHALAVCGTRVKDEALAQMAHALEEKSAALLEANRADLERARTKGLTRAFIDRLTLTEARIEEMANGLRQIAALPAPVGTVVESWRRPNGIEISRVRVPLGVIGFIYESRPNVTADAAGLCIKSGNAVVVRGGSEAIESNTAIAAVLARALEKVGAPADAVQYVDTTDRAAVAALLELDRLVDLIIARGEPGDGRRLGHRVSGSDALDPRGRRPRHRARPHPASRDGPRGDDRDQRPRACPPVHPRGRRRGGARQRVDAAGGRQPVRDGRRDGHRDVPGARPRAGAGARPAGHR